MFEPWVVDPFWWWVREVLAVICMGASISGNWLKGSLSMWGWRIQIMAGVPWVTIHLLNGSPGGIAFSCLITLMSVRGLMQWKAAGIERRRSG